MIESSYAVYGTFIVYLILMLGIGLYAYRRTASSSDYFLGGRSLGPWPAALSAGASDMSGWLLLGLPGYAFTSGLESLWLAGGLLLGTWANWRFTAQRLRTYSIEAGDALTLPEYFANRFCDNTRLIQIISAFFVLLFFLFYTSSGLVAGGKLFETVFGLEYSTALIVGTICIVSYTLFGGFLAVSWTDLVQGLLMAAALMIVPIAVIQADGGFGAMWGAVEARNPELLTLFNGTDGEALGFIAIISLAAWGLGYFGQPHILARFAACRSNRDINTARRIAVGWTGLSMAGAILVGLAGMVYVEAELGGVLQDGETIFMLLVNAIFHPIIAGILLAAILAAIMSTADSQLLVSSSALAEDFYKQLLRKNASQKEIVMVGRLAVIGLSFVAMMLAFDPDSTVLGLVSYAWAGFGAAFGPALLISLYWKNMTRNGALAGIVIGAVTVVVWKQLSGGLFDMYEIVPGIVFATVGIFVVSKLGSQPDEEIQAQHQRMLKNL